MAEDRSQPASGATPLVSVAETTSPAAMLRRLGLRPRKRFSQSFLVDKRLPGWIAEAADVRERDAVLEIGPGLGVLTRALAARAARVVTVELDRDLASVLPRLVPANVDVVLGDGLELDPAAHFPGPYKLVANLPYQVATAVVARYLDARPSPAVLVVMVQKEVAQRITAPRGELSYLGVAVQSAATARLLRVVPPGAFFPRPKVDSAILRLDPLAAPLVEAERRAAFLRLVRAGFAQPRKQLANSLAQGLGTSRPVAAQRIERAGLDPSRRPQDLGLDEWRALFDAA